MPRTYPVGCRLCSGAGRQGGSSTPDSPCSPFPYWWYYDVLRGLDYFRSTGLPADDRCAGAIDLVVDKRDEAGRWRLENVHMGPTHFRMEGPEGAPSRWNTLRAGRVLEWAGV
ncbi:MAG: hypothetical protein ACLFWH_10560 [Actinomycetota bacterium]